jgi:hypothetical protein
MTLAPPPLPPTNDIEPGKEYYTVTRRPNPIVLDGSLLEWTGVPVLADPKFSIPKGSGTAGTYVLFEEYQGGTWSGPDDQTSAVQVVFDAENVYFGFVVTDDFHENAANSAWNGDSVQLMIASADRTAQVALYNYALGGVESALGSVIVMHEAGPGGTEAVVARNTGTKRTTYEIKLPKASLGLTDLVGGTQFGLGMAINDGDELTPGQKGWGGLGAHAIVFGKTPQQTALMTLQSYNDIEPGKERYTATAASSGIAVDGSLSEWISVPVIADPKFSIPKGSGAAGTGTYVLFEEYQGGTWTGPDDQTSAVQVVYDAENVYFGFVVTDDFHENAANSAWNGDSIQLMIASADRTAQVALYNYALGGIETTLGDVIVMHEAGPGGTTAAIVRDTLNNKTTYEIKLPVASLGLAAPLTLGTQFGLGMAINDGDELTPGQKGWGGLGAHSIVFGKTPGETALITLGNAGSGTALFFLSAINPAIASFSFRANDLGTSIVDPTSARLRIDGQLVPLVASPKVLDATDFTYIPTPPPFAPGGHTYSIEIRDTQGNLVTDSGSFITPANPFPILIPGHQAVSVDTNMPGFIWRIFQNQAAAPFNTNLASCELGLIGQLVDEFGIPIEENFADPAAVGIALGAGTQDGTLVRFEIPTVINLSKTGGEANGGFSPDDQMPGLPGAFGGGTDGLNAEIITFVELPAGVTTLGVTSDDRFRAQAGYVSDPTTGLLLGESEIPSSTTFRFLAQYAGIYPIRVIYQDGGFDSPNFTHIELFSVKSDSSRVLLNDTANGGLRAYRVGVIPVSTASRLSIQIVGGQRRVTWTASGVVLQESTDLANWSDLLTATSPYIATGSRPVVFYRLRNQ